MPIKYFKYKDDGHGSIASDLASKTSIYSVVTFHEDVVPEGMTAEGCLWKYGFAEIPDRFSQERTAECELIARRLIPDKEIYCLTNAEFLSEIAKNTSVPESAPGCYVLDGIEHILVS